MEMIGAESLLFYAYYILPFIGLILAILLIRGIYGVIKKDPNVNGVWQSFFILLLIAGAGIYMVL